MNLEEKTAQFGDHYSH